jgi:UDP-3-O-[3-hydroxymyristoyl] N-acetylglucosamine deacetylase/3-hydroxyacyl-[acyl-carrier-protein] dehydratase
MERQRTINRELSIKGVGLHTANKVCLTFRPAPPDSGVNFIRTDLAGNPKILVSLENLLPLDKSARRTSICFDNIEIHTVEHLLAALAGLSIDNLYILIDGNEVPGLDGSAKGFMEALLEAGISEQDREKKYFSLREPVSVEEGDAFIIALPYSNFRISYTLNYNHPLLKAQYLDLVITPDTFKKEIAEARTFCLEEEISDILSLGLGKGANYENTLVLGKDGIIKNKLRFEDEFTRHKILDLIGDLGLLGFCVNMHIVANKSGHALNIKLLKKIYQQKKRYEAGGVKAVYSPSEGEELDATTITKILPHRYPFSLSIE